MAKEFARKFYSSASWQACRNEYIEKKHHLCENCLKRGIYSPGEIVHHVIEVTPVNIDNPEITLNHNNLELLCRQCHLEIHDHHYSKWDKINKKRKEQRDQRRRFKISTNGEIFPQDIPPHHW